MCSYILYFVRPRPTLEMSTLDRIQTTTYNYTIIVHAWPIAMRDHARESAVFIHTSMYVYVCMCVHIAYTFLLGVPPVNVHTLCIHYNNMQCADRMAESTARLYFQLSTATPANRSARTR